MPPPASRGRCLPPAITAGSFRAQGAFASAPPYRRPTSSRHTTSMAPGSPHHVGTGRGRVGGGAGRGTRGLVACRTRSFRQIWREPSALRNWGSQSATSWLLMSRTNRTASRGLAVRSCSDIRRRNSRDLLVLDLQFSTFLPKATRNERSANSWFAERWDFVSLSRSRAFCERGVCRLQTPCRILCFSLAAFRCCFRVLESLFAGLCRFEPSHGFRPGFPLVSAATLSWANHMFPGIRSRLVLGFCELLPVFAWWRWPAGLSTL